MAATSRAIPALFLHHTGHLDPDGGGVQICTHEYFVALEAAGFRPQPIEIPYDRRLLAKVRRRVDGNPYRSWIDVPRAVELVQAATLRQGDIRYIFLNQHSLGALAAPLKRSLPGTQLVMLSHGLESTDYLHAMRDPGGPPRPRTSRLRMLVLGARLVDEARHARALDHVFCLSEFEREIEHWLGADDVTVVPRTVERHPLDWRPRDGRLGFVGTLDHQPNREGLVLFLEAMAALDSRAEVRVVGSPRPAGEALARRYPQMRYLGPLSRQELEAEASTWHCFLHPLFCHARGASTKLATGLAWELPIVTTTVGRRGYTWRAGQLPIADDPVSFTRLALSMTDLRVASNARREVARVAATSPTTADVAALMRRALGLPELRQNTVEAAG